MYELRRVLSVPARRADALAGDLPSLAQQRGLCAGEVFFAPRRSEEEERFEAHPCVVGDGIKKWGGATGLSLRAAHRLDAGARPYPAREKKIVSTGVEKK